MPKSFPQQESPTAHGYSGLLLLRGSKSMFFNNRIVTRNLKRAGFTVEAVWLDACSTHHDLFYVGLRLEDEPIPEITRLDLAAVVDKWATIGMLSPVKNDGVVVVLVVRGADLGMAVPQ
jgi:hypothetical protein